MFARLLVSALMVAAFGAPALAQTENLQTFRDVQRQVLRYAHFTIFDSVKAHFDEDGVVTLTGKVTMPHKRSDIERRVARVVGAHRINNEIEVLPASQGDDRLRYLIARAIYGHPAFSNYGSMVNPPIHIIVERGRVTLEGVVGSEVDRLLARTIATSFDAFDVKSELQTDEEVEAELERL